MLAVGVRGSQKSDGGHRIYLELPVTAMAECDNDYILYEAGRYCQ